VENRRFSNQKKDLSGLGSSLMGPSTLTRASHSMRGGQSVSVELPRVYTIVVTALALSAGIGLGPSDASEGLHIASYASSPPPTPRACLFRLPPRPRSDRRHHSLPWAPFLSPFLSSSGNRSLTVAYRALTGPFTKDSSKKLTKSLGGGARPSRRLCRLLFFPAVSRFDRPLRVSDCVAYQAPYQKDLSVLSGRWWALPRREPGPAPMRSSA